MTCFICDPENPEAAEEGCWDCEMSWWRYVDSIYDEMAEADQ